MSEHKDRILTELRRRGGRLVVSAQRWTEPGDDAFREYGMEARQAALKLVESGDAVVIRDTYHSSSDRTRCGTLLVSYEWSLVIEGVEA